MSQSQEITIYDVLQIPPGDDAWINDEFRGLVTDAKKGFDRAPSTATVRDVDNQNVKIKVSAFKGVDMTRYEGKVCLFSGKAMKRTEYQGVDQFTISDKTTINVISTPNQRAAAPAQSAAAPASTVTNPAPATTVQEEGAKQFHTGMKRLGTFWLHCYSYMKRAEGKLPSDALTPEQFQAGVSSLFIEGCRRGLGDRPPPLDSAGSGPAKPPAPQSTGRVETANREQQEEMDPDVPF